MNLAFLVAARSDAASGGYVYDRRIVAGLREAGHRAEIVQLPGALPLADAASRAAAEAAWAALAPDAVPVIDGLALPAFQAIGPALAARAAIGLIHHPTALDPGHSEEQRAALRAIETRLMARLPRVITTSEATAERLAAAFGVARERISVVTPGTENAPRSTGSGGPGCAVLSIGPLVPRKGHDVLLRALGRLFDLEWTLRVVGSAERDPVHAHTLSALAEELGIASRVRFLGELDEGSLEACWQKADLFALATHWEGYAMPVAEALKRGLPVAVTGGGAAGALVPAEGGAVCPPGDPATLSKALRRLIFSAELRAAMSTVAWEAGQALPGWAEQTRAFAAAIGA